MHAEFKYLESSQNNLLQTIHEKKSEVLTEQNKVNDFFSKLNICDKLTSLTPTACYLDSVVGFFLRADANVVKNYRLAQKSLQVANRNLHTKESELLHTETLLKLSLNICKNEQQLHSMQQIASDSINVLNVFERDLHHQWNGLSFKEKTIYYLPTNWLRKQAASCVNSRLQMISSCSLANKRYHEAKKHFNNANKAIDNFYREIYKSIGEKILLAPSSQKDRDLACSCMHTFALSAKLAVACDNAWGKMQDYHHKDREATYAERNAWDDEDEEDAEYARSDADGAKYSLQQQINKIQKLTRLLDEQVHFLKANYNQPLYVSPLERPLENANTSIDLYDWTDGLANSSGWGFIHDIAESLNNYSIQDEFMRIQRHAKGINSQLENSLVKLFANQRRWYLHENEQHIVNEEQDRQHILSYLTTWAQPGIFEYII